MIVLPAIDLKDGTCVRLREGDFETAHQVAADPLEAARSFRAAGANWVHMVDLDGALLGAAKNRPLVRSVVEQSGLKVELGGGIRSLEDVENALAMGAARVVIGSAAVTDRALVKEAARRYGDRIAVGVDCRDGFVHTKGWRVNSGLSGLAFARDMAELGVRTLVVTDIARDGMERGPSFELLYAMAETGCRIIASGGVTDLSDIRRLRDHGLYGAIAGKAVYSGKLPLGEAIRLAGETEGKKGD